MDVLRVFAVLAIGLQSTEGAAPTPQSVPPHAFQVYPEFRHIAAEGTEVNLTCVVSGKADDISTMLVKLWFNGTQIHYCDFSGLKNNTQDQVCKGMACTCAYTISSVDVSQAGPYMCSLYTKETPQSTHNSSMKLIVIAPNPSIELLDPSTGDRMEDKSERICVQPDTEQTFTCRVLEIEPDAWQMQWLFRDGEVEPNVRIIETVSTGGLGNMTGSFTVSSAENEGLEKNLTCRATDSENNTLSVTVKLKFCTGFTRKLLYILLAVDAVALAIGITAMALIYKHKDPVKDA